MTPSASGRPKNTFSGGVGGRGVVSVSGCRVGVGVSGSGCRVGVPGRGRGAVSVSSRPPRTLEALLRPPQTLEKRQGH